MGGARLAIEVDDAATTAGSELHGVVRVVDGGDLRSLKVELGRIESSGRTLPPAFRTVASSTVPTPASVESGQTFPFSIRVPAGVAPAFRTANGSCDWALRTSTAGFGSASDAERSVTVVAGPDRLDAAAARALAATAAEASQADRPANTRLAWVFIAIGVVFVVLGAIWSASPPASWEEQGTGPFALAFSFGIGVLLVGCGVVVLRSQVIRPIGPLQVTLAPPAVRPGETVRVELVNDDARPLAVGLESVEVVERETSGQHRTRYHREYVLSSQWQALPAGRSSAEFTVPVDAIATHAGERITIAHRIAVVPAGKERSARNRSRHRTPLAVLP